MAGVIEKRRELLESMREQTLKNGFFTVNDIGKEKNLARSTVQDWVNRLVSERCVVLLEEKHGRIPARYAARSAVLKSSCKRIFTTTDHDVAAVFHECTSFGCASFCTYHHRLAGGAVIPAKREGKLLIEYSAPVKKDVVIGTFPRASAGITDIRIENGYVYQRIRCFGGPAYSLTDMMKRAEGVIDIDILPAGNSEIQPGLIEGEIKTRAMVHMIIGIDDTDSKSDGATFVLALSLMQYLKKHSGVFPIVHRVVMLNPALVECTAGNSASYIEIAVLPENADEIRDSAVRFIRDESLSEDWGIVIKTGFIISRELREYGFTARKRVVTLDEALIHAEKEGIFTAGGKGIIGALAAVSLCGLDTSVLLCPAVLTAQEPELPPHDICTEQRY